jgi:hypothetical protein
MADPNTDFDTVPLRGDGPWLIGRNHGVLPVPGDYETQFVASAEDCCSVIGPAPFEAVGRTYIGRALLIIPQLADLLPPGTTLFFSVEPGWQVCCGTPAAFGLYVVPMRPPACIELVQIDGLMHPTLRLRASTGTGGATIVKVPWRMHLIPCCTERRVTYGPGVTPNVVPP